MEIPELKIELGDVNIRDLRSIEVPEWMAQPSYAIPVAPPVTTQVGVPIVNMPGCVEAHVDSKENQSLKDEDKDGVRTFCDAGTPSFNPIDYDPNRLKLEQEAPPPPAIKPVVQNDIYAAAERIQPSQNQTQFGFERPQQQQSRQNDIDTSFLDDLL